MKGIEPLTSPIIPGINNPNPDTGVQEPKGRIIPGLISKTSAENNEVKCNIPLDHIPGFGWDQQLSNYIPTALRSLVHLLSSYESYHVR